MTQIAPDDASPPPRSRLARMPRVVTGLVALIIVAHAATVFMGVEARNTLMLDYGVVPATDSARILPLFSHVFLHAGWLHLMFNVFLILQTGELVALRLGASVRGALEFLALFFVSGAAGALMYIAINPESQAPAIGASGAACGLFAAYLLALAPTWRIALRTPAILQMGFYFLLVNVGVAMLARATDVLPIAWEAHAGGFLAGLVAYPVLKSLR